MLNNIDFLHRASLDFKINFTEALPLGYGEEEKEDRKPDIIVVWETAVMPLTERQRITFFVLTTIVSIVAILGNALVLYVNFTR
jgi:hypothetical protein